MAAWYNFSFKEGISGRLEFDVAKEEPPFVLYIPELAWVDSKLLVKPPWRASYGVFEADLLKDLLFI